MEKEKKKSSIVLRIFLFLILFIVISFATYYTVMSLLSTSRAISDINEKYSFKQTEKETIDERLFSDSSFVSLQKDKAFFQSRLTMASTDSIGLTLNLEDSLACLEINGVVVHKTKISYKEESKAFNKANTFAVASMFSSPLTIVHTYSTIKRVPLLIKMAPKDTSEYKPDITPDTSAYEPVNYILEMDNGIRIFVYQEENKKSSDLYDQIYFDLTDRLRNTLETLKMVKHFKVPEYHPYIKIKLPKADAKIIYRALPAKGLITVYR